MKHSIGMVLVCMLIPSCLAFGQRVRLPEGTPVHVRLKADLASDQVEEGARVDFEVASPVLIQGIAVIPVGAVSWGTVQSVKKGKFIKLDIDGVRLPDLTDVKLRTVGGRTKNPAQDQIKVDASFKGGVGAPKGTEYTAYVNEDREVAVAAQPSSPALAPTPTAAATTPPTPAETTAPTPPAATPSTATPAVTYPKPAAPPAVTAPAASATSLSISPSQSAAPLGNVERARVECFSDPSAADILIDGDFYGNTPSILKVPVGKHELEIQLSGYKTYSITLILEPGTGIRHIRASLEEKE
ncbi:MAG: PEGA domain-containing protein [Terriglobia bacterium]